MGNFRQEARWVLQAQCGDRGAVDALLKAIATSLHRYLLAATTRPDMADDLLQDTLILVVQRISHLREPCAFRAWTYRIANRLAKRRLRELQKMETLAEDNVDMELVDPGATDQVVRRLEYKTVMCLITELPAASRAVLWLHYIDELSISAIADVLEIPLGTVKSRLSYGVTLLRRRLANEKDKSPA